MCRFTLSFLPTLLLFFLPAVGGLGQALLPSELPPLVIGEIPKENPTPSTSSGADSTASSLGSWERIEALEKKIRELEARLKALEESQNKDNKSSHSAKPPSPEKREV